MEQVRKMTQEAPVNGQTKSAKGEAKFSLQFLESFKSEFHKVSWTGKEELFTYTKIVVASTFVAAFAIYGVDLVIQGVLGILSYIF